MWVGEMWGKQYNDGESPSGGVVLDKTGNVYGTTAYGGTGDCVLLGIKGGCGTFFELSPPKQKGGAWTETILYSFQSGNDGYFPWGTLTWDSKGNLYGATEFGGGKGNTCNVYFQYCGTVFKLSPPNQKGGAWTERVLHSFAGGTDGANPNGGLLLDSKGAIYGTTSSGGNQGCQYQGEVGCGTAFKLTPPTKKGGVWTQEQLHVFSGGNDGANPNGNLVLGKGAGDLYGTAGGGKESRGVVFRFAPTRGSRWVETVIYNFTDGKDGLGPSAVIMDSSGNLYGPALGGGSNGVIFKLALAKHNQWKLTVLYTFQGSPDGAGPEARLTFDAAGNLYSTTVSGGSGNGDGTVFEVSP